MKITRLQEININRLSKFLALIMCYISLFKCGFLKIFLLKLILNQLLILLFKASLKYF